MISPHDRFRPFAYVSEKKVDSVSRRNKLEVMLVTDPDDPFLHYALALELVKEGERVEGLRRLAEMNAKFLDHVPAYFRRGQLLAEMGDIEGARDALLSGLQAAERTGDDHAAAEMNELLSSL